MDLLPKKDHFEDFNKVFEENQDLDLFGQKRGLSFEVHDVDTWSYSIPTSPEVCYQAMTALNNLNLNHTAISTGEEKMINSEDEECLAPPTTSSLI
jgi:hypothetical protein